MMITEKKTSEEKFINLYSQIEFLKEIKNFDLTIGELKELCLNSDKILESIKEVKDDIFAECFWNIYEKKIQRISFGEYQNLDNNEYKNADISFDYLSSGDKSELFDYKLYFDNKKYLDMAVYQKNSKFVVLLIGSEPLPEIGTVNKKGKDYSKYYILDLSEEYTKFKRIY